MNTFIGTFNGGNIILDDKKDKTAIDLIEHQQSEIRIKDEEIKTLRNKLLSAQVMP